VVGEAAGDGVADVVEAGLTVAAVVSFDSTELTSYRTDSLSRFFFASAPYRKRILKFQRWLLFHV